MAEQNGDSRGAGRSRYEWAARAPEWADQAAIEAMERMFFAALAEAGYPDAEEAFTRFDDAGRTYRTYRTAVPDDVAQRARVLVFERFGVPYTEILDDGTRIEHEGRRLTDA